MKQIGRRSRGHKANGMVVVVPWQGLQRVSVLFGGPLRHRPTRRRASFFWGKYLPCYLGGRYLTYIRYLRYLHANVATGTDLACGICPTDSLSKPVELRRLCFALPRLISYSATPKIKESCWIRQASRLPGLDFASSLPASKTVQQLHFHRLSTCCSLYFCSARACVLSTLSPRPPHPSVLGLSGRRQVLAFFSPSVARPSISFCGL